MDKGGAQVWGKRLHPQGSESLSLPQCIAGELFSQAADGKPRKHAEGRSEE